MEPASVLVVGSINTDLVVATDHLPRPGETVAHGTFSRFSGGKGANQAVAASRFGAQVTLVGAVGDDDFGRHALKSLQEDSVETSRISVSSGETTGVALVVVDHNGNNQIAAASGANATITAKELSYLLSATPRGVLLTCFEIPEAAVDRTVSEGRAAGWQVVVNPAPARPLPPELFDSGVILTPNERELFDISGIDDVEAGALHLVREITKAPVVVTLGAQGALIATLDDLIHVEAPEVTVRDTTGAGDCFNGVFAAVLSSGGSILDATKLGVAAASCSVEVTGARKGMLTRAEFDARRPFRNTNTGVPPVRP